MSTQQQHNVNLSSDDTPAVRAQKIAAAEARAKEDAVKEAEEKAKAAVKADAAADKEAHKNAQVASGSEPHNPDAKVTSKRLHETVKAGQSGGGKHSTKLNRAQMEQVIKEGGSVLYNGVLHNNVGSLPPESELVAGDEEAEKRVAAELQRQRDAIDAQLAKLKK